MVAARAAGEVAEVSRLLRERRYEPKPVKRVWIDKAGSAEKRPLGLPTVRDRIVQKALHIVLEPIFERDFAEHSYGFRPGRNAKQAVERVETLLGEGRHWVVDADIKGLPAFIAKEVRQAVSLRSALRATSPTTRSWSESARKSPTVESRR